MLNSPNLNISASLGVPIPGTCSPREGVFTSRTREQCPARNSIPHNTAGRKTVTDNGVLQYRQDYVSGIEYRYTTAGGLTLEAVYHSEGRVYNNGGTLRYEYSIRDHLGNTRLTFTDKNGNGVIDVTNM